MTIKKQYICDVCGDSITGEPSATNEWKRIKFASGNAFCLVPLVTTESASEKIICSKCLISIWQIKK